MIGHKATVLQKQNPQLKYLQTPLLLLILHKEVKELLQ